MSRSYKKNPGWKHKSRYVSFWKRQASKKVRKNWTVDSGSSYKRLYESFMIWEWNFRVYSSDKSKVRERFDVPLEDVHRFRAK